MRVEGKIQKRIRQLRNELRKGKIWFEMLYPLVEEARLALEAAKTKKELLSVVKEYFGYETMRISESAELT